MVGLRGFEPLTSPLSGVRSNQLSYRPVTATLAATSYEMGCRGRREPAQAFRTAGKPAARSPVMKGREDDGMFFGTCEALPDTRPGAFERILRKEVIQPQVPLRLPCYDFTPVAKPTVVACLSYELAQRLRVNPTPMV